MKTNFACLLLLFNVATRKLERAPVAPIEFWIELTRYSQGWMEEESDSGKNKETPR